VTAFIAAHLNHTCAAIITFTIWGALRASRAQRGLLGPARLGQLLLLAWLALLLLVTYLLPPMGIWGVGVVVPLLADQHWLAWLANAVGPEPLLKGLEATVRRTGTARYLLVASTQQALHAALGLLLVAVSPGRNSWEYWLGYGIVSSAGLGVLPHLLLVRRLRRKEVVPSARGAA
jgi:hypothetical protein